LPSILLAWENRITTKAFYKRKAFLELEDDTDEDV
jgi:hypothetical protein